MVDKAVEEASIHMIKCRCPILMHLANDLPPAALHSIIKTENNNWKNSEGSHSFPSRNDTRLKTGRLPSADLKVAVINLHTPFSSTSNWLLLIWWRRKKWKSISWRLDFTDVSMMIHSNISTQKWVESSGVSKSRGEEIRAKSCQIL